MLFEAWAAGDVATLSLEIVAATGAGIIITVTNPQLGSGAIHIEIPAGTKERALLQKLNFSNAARRICRMTQVEESNDQAIVALLEETEFGESADGLVQWLEPRIGILGWGDRDLAAEDKNVGILWCGETEIVQTNVDPGGNDKWKALVVAGIAFQTNTASENETDIERAHEFIRQNALLDLFRMHLFAVTRVFAHKWMEGGLHDAMFGFANSMKDETLNTILPNARVRVVGNYTVRYEQPSFPFDALPSYPPSGLRIGLWRNPVTDVAGSPDSVRDSIITLDRQ